MDLALQTLVQHGKIFSATKDHLIVELPPIAGFSFTKIWLQIKENTLFLMVSQNENVDVESVRLARGSYRTLIEELSKLEPKAKPSSNGESAKASIGSSAPTISKSAPSSSQSN